MNAKPTLGPWLIDERTGIIVIYGPPEATEPCIAEAESRAIAIFHGERSEDGSHWTMPPEKVANAALVVAAVNSCFAVNPENPLAVAGALPSLIKACRETLSFLRNPNGWEKDHNRKGIFLPNLLEAALAKAEPK